MVPKEAIEEFKKLYKKRFKKDISDQEALRRATNLLGLYKVVYGLNNEEKNEAKRE